MSKETFIKALTHSAGGILAGRTGIDNLAPECAVPLDTPMKNLKAAGKTVVQGRRDLRRTES
mgnify:CR=1 FL=1